MAKPDIPKHPMSPRLKHFSGASTPLPEVDRREGRERRGLMVLLRRFRGALRRPLRLERRGLRWRVVLVDRRRDGVVFRPASERRLLIDLQESLLAIDAAHAAMAMGQLIRVHDLLLSKGWNAVEAMSCRDLGRAVAQCELLAEIGSPDSLNALADRLRVLESRARIREDRHAEDQRTPPADAMGVVAEASFDEYCEHERRLAATRQPESGGAEGAKPK